MLASQLQNMSLELASEVGDDADVTVYTQDGQIYTADNRTRAINDARKSVYFDSLNLNGVDVFCNKFKEFLKITNGIALSGNTSPVPFANDCRLVRKVVVRADTPSIAAPGRVCEEVPDEIYMEVKTQPGISSWEPSVTAPLFFYHDSGEIEILVSVNGAIVTLTEGEIDVIYLAEPIDSDLSADTIEPYIMYPAIKDKAYELLLKLRQKNQ
jgi:hypothetical protein